MRGAVFTIVEKCSRSWRGGGRLEIDRMADRVALGLFVLGSEVDAEREGLRVEAEAADRAAGEQFKRPGARAGARAVGRRGLRHLFVTRSRSI